MKSKNEIEFYRARLARAEFEGSVSFDVAPSIPGYESSDKPKEKGTLFNLAGLRATL